MRPPQPPPFVKEKFGKLESKKDLTAAKRILDRILGLAATAVCFALAKVLGAAFWLPTLLILTVWFIETKLRVDHAIRPMMAIFLGHTCWMVIGYVALYLLQHTTDFVWETSIDVGIAVGVSIWVFLS